MGLYTITGITELADAASRLSSEYGRLASTVENAKNTLTKVLDDLSVQAIDRDLVHGAKNISCLLLDHAEARRKLAEVHGKLARADLAFEIGWKRAQGTPEPDPTTGKPNKDWSEKLFQAARLADPGLCALDLAVIATTDCGIELAAELEAAQVRLSATRHRARLAASMLVFLAEPAGALPSLPTNTRAEE